MKNLIITLLIYNLFSITSFAGIVGDINSDNKINLTEAIHALQVSANIKSMSTLPNTIIGNTNKKLSGLVGVTKNSNEVVGVNTLFTKELNEGDTASIDGQIFTVLKISDDKHLLLDSYHTVGTSNSFIYTDDDLLSIQNSKNIDKVTVDKTGNVGIGTNIPSSKLEVKGSIKADSYIGIFKPYNKMLKWELSERRDLYDVDLGLDDTNAKFLMASVYAYNSAADHVVHIFGYSLDRGADYSGPLHYQYNDNVSNNYVVFVHNGNGDGTHYPHGNHEFLIIPLKENHRFDAILSYGHDQDNTNYLKIRAIGYME